MTVRDNLCTIFMDLILSLILVQYTQGVMTIHVLGTTHTRLSTKDFACTLVDYAVIPVAVQPPDNSLVYPNFCGIKLLLEK